MPSIILQSAKTTWVDPEPFQIPNGPTITTIKLEVDGKNDLYKTMSKALAIEGWQGDVEVYTNDSGKTYVRQAPKEDSGYNKPSGSSNYQPKDNTSITLNMVWKTILNISGLPEDEAQFDSLFKIVEEHTERLVEIAEKIKNANN